LFRSDAPPASRVRGATRDELAGQLLARTDAAPGSRGMLVLAVDSAAAPDAFVAAVEGARTGRPVVAVDDGLFGPYTREFLVNRAAAVGGFVLMRDAGSMPPKVETSLRKAVSR
ncbi:MAG: hypothetical protein HGB10_11330, partial [Coriobacteriia bacterium]|nr:hypothetical protein [Coriobacteriia bacterium]